MTTLLRILRQLLVNIKDKLFTKFTFFPQKNITDVTCLVLNNIHFKEGVGVGWCDVFGGYIFVVMSAFGGDSSGIL